MEVIICDSAEQAVSTAARLVARQVREEPGSVLGLATGGTMVPLYAQLVALQRAGEADFSATTTFNLDEFVGVPASSGKSYAHYMHRQFFDPAGLDPARCHLPDGMADDIPAACAAYEQAIEDAGGLDLQLLGIGANGHIGFNEPASSLASRTRIKTLTPESLATSGWDADDPAAPKHVITMGIATIMAARQVLLLALGADKAGAIAACVEGPISAMCPASVLQMHEHATVIVDAEAAGALEHADYYRHVYAHKPSWQR